MLKTAVVTPMPTAKATTARIATDRVRRAVRTANRKSCASLAIRGVRRRNRRSGGPAGFSAPSLPLVHGQRLDVAAAQHAAHGRHHGARGVADGDGERVAVAPRLASIGGLRGEGVAGAAIPTPAARENHAV